MSVQSITLLSSAVSLAPGTYRRPDPAQTPTGMGVPAAASWYKIVIDVSAMTNPAHHFEFRGEFSLDGGNTWIEYGGGGRDGGQGFKKDGVTPLNTCSFYAGQSAQNPGDQPLPGTGLPLSQRRVRALLVTSGGTFTIGPVTVFGGTSSDTPPADT